MGFRSELVSFLGKDTLKLAKLCNEIYRKLDENRYSAPENKTLWLYTCLNVDVQGLPFSPPMWFALNLAAEEDARRKVIREFGEYMLQKHEFL